MTEWKVFLGEVGGGVIKSYEVDRLIAEFDKLFGKNWGHIAGSITESVILEEYLFNTSANY